MAVQLTHAPQRSRRRPASIREILCDLILSDGFRSVEITPVRNLPRTLCSISRGCPLASFIGQLNWPRPFYELATFGLILGLLYFLAPVLVPIALGVLLTFLLAPVVSWLEHRRFNRVAAVGVVVVLAAMIFAGVGWVVSRQASALVDALPQYEQGLSSKLSALRRNSAGLLDQIRLLTRNVEEPLPGAAADGRGANGAPPLVRVEREESHLTLGGIAGSLTAAIAPLARMTLIVMLVVFMLIWREDLRDRVLGLVGHGRITVTTKALDEAGQRIASYLLTQLIVNAGFGIALGLGLLLIGIPYAVLWGILGALFRYAPYVGAALGALFPIAFSVLTMDGWRAPLLAFGWFVIIESSANFLIEPWIYSRRVGLSPAAALIMVAFWTWLWGPLGLILAYPMSVCLVVLGQFVPYLKFLDTLLGDRPVLDPRTRFFQRLLARDLDEATGLAEGYLAEHGLAPTFDELLLPALVAASTAAGEATLAEEEHAALVRDCGTIVEGLASMAELGASDEQARATSLTEQAAVIALAARDSADELAVAMLAVLLGPARARLKVFGAELLAAEAAAAVEAHHPALVCIASVGRGGVARAAALSRRLRRHFPQLQIVVARWDGPDGDEAVRRTLSDSGANSVVTNFGELHAHVMAVREAAPPRFTEVLQRAAPSFP
jgi:predicted PurR-regulated permease PerM